MEAVRHPSDLVWSSIAAGLAARARAAELTDPLAVVYVGRRYLDDNGVPAFAAGADLDVALPAGRLIAPSVAEQA